MLSYVVTKRGTGWRLGKRLICQSAAHLSNLSTGSATYTHRQFPWVITAAIRIYQIKSSFVQVLVLKPMTVKLLRLLVGI